MTPCPAEQISLSPPPGVPLSSLPSQAEGRFPAALLLSEADNGVFSRLGKVGLLEGTVTQAVK